MPQTFDKQWPLALIFGTQTTWDKCSLKWVLGSTVPTAYQLKSAYYVQLAWAAPGKRTFERSSFALSAVYDRPQPVEPLQKVWSCSAQLQFENFLYSAHFALWPFGGGQSPRKRNDIWDLKVRAYSYHVVKFIPPVKELIPRCWFFMLWTLSLAYLS